MAVTEIEISCKLDELDRLLNDPDVAIEPLRVWSLLAELSVPEPSVQGRTPPPPRG